jgi:hypothetical protein
MDDILAQRTVRDYCCAHCWGHLERNPVEGGWQVFCPNCGPDQGYVTRAYAEARRAESQAEKLEVTQLLTSLGVIPAPPKRSEAEIMQELGF